MYHAEAIMKILSCHLKQLHADFALLLEYKLLKVITMLSLTVTAHLLTLS